MPSDKTELIAQSRAPHLRVTGPPASGKTSLLVERFRRLSEAGENCVAITWGRAQQERLVDAVVAGASFGRLPVYTHTQIAATILDNAAGHRRALLRDVDEQLVLGHVLADAGSALSSDYGSVLRSPDFQRTLLETLHVLLQNGVTATGAGKTAKSAAGARARDVLALYARFHDTLHSNDLVTFYDAAWRAAEALDVDPGTHPFPDATHILIDDFQDIDAGQFQLLRSLAPPDGTIGTSVFGDSTGARFRFRGTDDRFLQQDYVEAYTPESHELESPLAAHAELNGVVAELVVSVHRETATPAAGENDLPLFASAPRSGDRVALSDASGPEASLFVAADVTAESQEIARRVAAMLRDEDVTPGDVAVVVREAHVYAVALAQAFRDEGVPFDTGERGTFALTQFVDTLIGLLGADVSERALEAAIASPFWNALREVLAERVELPERSPRTDLSSARRVAGYLRKTFAGRSSDGIAIGRLIAEVLEPITRASVVEIPDDAARELIETATEWAKFRETQRRIGRSGPGTHAGAFRRYLADVRRGRRATRRAGCVGLFAARETTGTMFPVVFVAGCAEGIFPAVTTRDSYIPYGQLETALDGVTNYPIRFYRATASDERLSEENALLLTALSRAARHLTVSLPLLYAEEKRAPAPALLPICDVTALTPVPRTTGTHLTVARAIAAQPAGTATSDGLSFVEAAWLAERSPAAIFRVEDFEMSPSRLETYVKCPRKLFYTRVMRIDEDSSIHLTIGSLFHELMELAGKRFETGDALSAGLKSEWVREAIDEIISNSHDLGPRGSLLESITRHYLNEMAGSVAELERGRVSDFSLDAAEQTRPFEHNGVPFLGKIDRVDRTRFGYGVVDYKTGRLHKTGQSIKKYMLEPKEDNSRYWQVPFYVFATRTESGGFPSWFCYYVIPADAEPLGVGLMIDEDGAPPSTTDPFGDRLGTKKRFTSITRSELTAVMDEAAGIVAGVFTDHEMFERTENLKSCSGCYFAGVCERKE